MAKAFGKDMAARLLKHYPYVYCPAMKGLFNLSDKPKRGDIVLFYRSGTFAHTGLVTAVNGDYFTTVEGNTSGGSTIIANGGAVCKKSYYLKNLTGTKFAAPDYSIVPAPQPEEYTDIEAIAWDLHHRGIIEDKQGLIDEVKKQPNGRLYWLARKTLQYIRKRD